MTETPSTALAPQPSSPPALYRREEAQCMGPYFVSQEPPLFLSAVLHSDIPEMVRILNLDDSVFRNSSYFKFPYPEDLARTHVARADRVIESQGVNAHWAMRTSPDGKIMGWLSLHPIKPKPPTATEATTAAAVGATSENALSHPLVPKVKEGRTGYWVSPEYRNQGYARRALAYLLNEIAAKEQGFDLVRADAYAENLASQRVMERAGMVLQSTDHIVTVEAYGPGVQKRSASFSWWSPLSAHPIVSND
ncbi:hypothetical protein EMPS_02235 [Entomortierella parvispora]|uniref:N-acetyltransferase domain-containing protein n=1 Tax=Entomortierella parvispora TaxID=205924 RepID=A0A9P3H4E9_9FUNG|nr:hypothetical protein EMPS_02235 [Entomortierella parvispora]